jgi:hypothetical protein
MQDYTLRREGDEPLRFDGELVAESSGFHFKGREQNRWHEVRVYRTDLGDYVAEIVYGTQWEQEAQTHRAAQVPRRRLSEALRGLDPLADAVGPPEAAMETDKTLFSKWCATARFLRRNYMSMVADVLGDLPAPTRAEMRDPGQTSYRVTQSPDGVCIGIGYDEVRAEDLIQAVEHFRRLTGLEPREGAQKSARETDGRGPIYFETD